MKKNNSPQITTLLEAVTNWAKQQPDIWGIALVGSWARGTQRPDSDLDLLFLTPNQHIYRENINWLNTFPWAELETPVQQWRDETYGVVWSRHVQLEGWPEIEFTFALPTWAQLNPADEGTIHVVQNGYQIVYDPQGLFKQLYDYVQTLRE